MDGVIVFKLRKIFGNKFSSAPPPPFCRIPSQQLSTAAVVDADGCVAVECKDEKFIEQIFFMMNDCLWGS